MPGVLSPARPPRRGAAVACLFACLALSGCLSTRFIFNQLDWFITWRLNSYFSLDEDQERALRAAVTRTLERLRTEQMPRLAAILRDVERDVASGAVTAASLQRHYQALVATWDDFLRMAVPEAADFLSGLRSEQVEVLIANLADENEELWNDYAGDTPAKRRQRREKAIVRNLQRFTGRLNKDQKALIREQVGRMHDNAEEWMQGRREWQRRFRDLLLERPPPAEFRRRLLAMVLDPNAVDSADYRRRVDENRRIVFEMLAGVLRSLDERQRRHFSRRVNELAADLESLAAD